MVWEPKLWYKNTNLFHINNYFESVQSFLSDTEVTEINNEDKVISITFSHLYYITIIRFFNAFASRVFVMALVIHLISCDNHLGGSSPVQRQVDSPNHPAKSWVISAID